MKGNGSNLIVNALFLKHFLSINLSISRHSGSPQHSQIRSPSPVMMLYFHYSMHNKFVESYIELSGLKNVFSLQKLVLVEILRISQTVACFHHSAFYIELNT